MRQKNTLRTGFLATAACYAALASAPLFAAQGTLLGLTPGYPRIDTNPIGICTYDEVNGLLTVKDLPTFVNFSPTGPLAFVAGGQLSLTANIDNTGLITGGAFTVTGSVTGGSCSPSCASPLLTGTVADYGILNTSPTPGTDNADFLITPTGGSLLPLYAPGDQIGMTLTMEGSTYDGAMTSAWSCTKPKAIVGPVPPVEACGLTLVKTATPTTIGPITGPDGGDNEGDDSDSHSDHNMSGDSDDSDDDNLTCGCKGKVTQLVLQYNGLTTASVVVNRLNPAPTQLFAGTVAPGALFTVNGPVGEGAPGGGTLGANIEILVNGGGTVQIHTSCSQPIGPGLVAGDFEVISGMSRKLSVPLCPVVAPACPLNQQVTYTYTVTNNGSPMTDVAVNDDKLGAIGTLPLLGTGETQVLTAEACLYETTTNIATASGALPSGTSCAAAPSSATVELLPPPPPGCEHGDSDSDSHEDHNYSGHSDDSDSDSGPENCDDDDDTPPPPPPPVVYQGCTPGYWKQVQHTHHWVDRRPGDKFDAVFEVDAPGNKTLLMTLKEGGGGKDALGRHAVAALLNALNPDVTYAYSPTAVIDIVRDAYASGDYESAKNLLAEQNEKGCPLDNSDHEDGHRGPHTPHCPHRKK